MLHKLYEVVYKSCIKFPLIWKAIRPLGDFATSPCDSLKIACVTLVIKEVSGHYASVIIVLFDKDILIF